MQNDIREREVETDLSRRKFARIQERFLKGPIPMRLIAKAANLPGQSLSVYLAVHHRTALTRQEWVTLPKGLMAQLGISRDAKSRALRELEAASLIRLQTAKGRSARASLSPDWPGPRNRQWAVTPVGLTCLEHEYVIPGAQLAETKGESRLAMWPLHMAEKSWVDIEAFLVAFSEALVTHTPVGWETLDLELSFQKAREMAAEAGKGGAAD